MSHDLPPSEDPRAVVLLALGRLRQRALLTAFTRALVRLGFWGLLLCLPLTQVPSHWVGPALALACSCIVIAAALWAEATLPRDLALAKRYDDHCGLKDRLTSALDMMGRDDPGAEALLADAARALETFHPEGALPFALPREGRLLPLPILLLAAALLLPGAARRAEARDPALLDALTSSAARLRAFVARQRDGEATPGRKERLERLDELAAELTKGTLEKKDALAKFTKLLDELKRDEERLELEEEQLRRKVKSFPGQKDQKLLDDVHRGDYQSAANRLKKLLEELKEQQRKLKEQGKAGLEKLKELEKKLKELEEVEAKLLKLMALRRDLAGNGEVMDFLKDVEGELGQLEDPEIVEGEWKKLGKLQPPGQGGNQVRKVKRQLTPPSDKAGSGTTDEWLGKDAQRSDHQREEQKLTIREAKGRSAFTQTQVANDGSRSRREAREVLKASRTAAEDTIQRQDVPAGYREYLRRYFDGLQPDGDAAGKTPAVEAPSGETPPKAEQGR
ncbi:MAG: hypothetical protein AB7N76_13425 [Planctomycetota bacterium]